jgi:hypothetical protein
VSITIDFPNTFRLTTKLIKIITNPAKKEIRLPEISKANKDDKTKNRNFHLFVTKINVHINTNEPATPAIGIFFDPSFSKINDHEKVLNKGNGPISKRIISIETARTIK